MEDPSKGFTSFILQRRATTKDRQRSPHCLTYLFRGVYLVINNYRVDFNTKSIDQQPFAVVSHSTGMGSVGCFVNHGNWEGRSFAPPPDFWVRVAESGVGNYFFSVLPPGKLAGGLDELPKGDRNAFEYIVKVIQTYKPDE